MTSYTAVYDEEGKVFYDWLYYNDAVNTARTQGKYLTFSEYVKRPDVKTIRKIRRVKEVLEDNLLGELVMDSSYLGKTVEGFTYPNGKAVKENEDLVVYADKTYLSKVIAMYAGDNKNYHYGTKNPQHALKDNEYKIEGDKLTIKGSAFITNKYYWSPGKKTITVYADGYKPQVIEAEVLKADTKPEEPEVPNQPEEPQKPENPGQGDNTPDAPGAKSLTLPADISQLKVGSEDMAFSISESFGVGTRAEVTAWIKSVTSVKVNGVKYSKASNTLGNVKKGEFGITFTDALKISRPTWSSEPATLVIEAAGYKSYTFTFDNSNHTVKILTAKETNSAGSNNQGGTTDERPENELKSLDIPEGTVLRNGKNFNEIVIKSDFGAKNAVEWIQNITSVTVDGKAYDKNTNGMFGGSAGTNKYGIKSGELTVGLSYNAIENRQMVNLQVLRPIPLYLIPEITMNQN